MCSSINFQLFSQNLSGIPGATLYSIHKHCMSVWWENVKNCEELRISRFHLRFLFKVYTWHLITYQPRNRLMFSSQENLERERSHFKHTKYTWVIFKRYAFVWKFQESRASRFEIVTFFEEAPKIDFSVKKWKRNNWCG